MREFEIAMLGPRSIGKTSLMAALYDGFDKSTKGINLQLVPDVDTQNRLDDTLAMLKSAVVPNDTLKLGDGIEGTTVAEQFIFDLGQKARKPDLRVMFHDYPGEWLLNGNAKDVETFVQRCSCIVIPINAAAVMVEKGKYHEQFNRANLVLRTLKKTLTQESTRDYGPRLVVLAPVKCETWTTKRARLSELVSAVTERYSELLEYLNSEAIRSDVALAIVPVQTLGCVEFSRVTLKKDAASQKEIPTIHYARTSIDAKYDPQDSEQLLRYSFRFLLKHYLATKSFPWLRNLLGLDVNLKDAIEQFAKGLRTDLPFQPVIQGHHLLG